MDNREISATIVAADLCVGYRSLIGDFLKQWDDWYSRVLWKSDVAIPLGIAQAIGDLRRCVMPSDDPGNSQRPE